MKLNVQHRSHRRTIWIAVAAAVGCVHALGQDVERQPAEPSDAPDLSVVIVEGQVTDAVGAGLEGVTVTVFHKSDKGERGKKIATATSESLGDFAVSSDKPIRGEVIVVLSKPQYTDLVREVTINPDELPPFLGETLTGNLEIIGRVESALDKKAVAWASVNLKAAYQEWFVETDEGGQFVVKGVAPGHGMLVVEAEGFGREQQRIARLEEPGKVIVSLKPERIIHIEVVDDRDKFIVGVTIECVDQQRGDFRTVMTDDKGAATLRGIHFDADILMVRLSQDEHVSTSGFDETIHPPSEKVESTHQLTMARAGRVEGRVMDQSTGDPVYGARVMTGDDAYDDTPRDWTDYQGHYRIRGVPPGQTVVTAHISGFAPELKTVEVAAGQASILDLELAAGAVLTGAVKDEDGNPVPGAEIVATRWREHGTLGLRAMTDRGGRFSMTSAPHDEFEIVVTAPGASPERLKVTVGKNANLTITLRKASPGAKPGALTTLEVGQQVPAVTVTTMTGESIDLTKLEGKTVVLDFWATWCAPCVAELPNLITLHEKFKARNDFMLIGVSRDFDAVDVRAFLKDHPEMTWPQVVGEDGGVAKAADSFGIVALPTIIVIGPDNRILAVGLSVDEIALRVQALLQSPEPQ